MLDFCGSTCRADLCRDPECAELCDPKLDLFDIGCDLSDSVLDLWAVSSDLVSGLHDTTSNFCDLVASVVDPFSEPTLGGRFLIGSPVRVSRTSFDARLEVCVC